MKFGWPPSLRCGRSRVIQFVSRSLPAAREHGSGTYALDLFRYLREQGFRIEYTLLGRLPVDFVGHYNIPREVFGLVRLSALGHASWGRVMFRRPRSSLGWAASITGVTYPQLPAPLQALHRLLKPERVAQPALSHSESPDVAPAFDDLPTAAELEFFKSEYSRLKPAVVIADYAWMAPIFDEMPAEPALKVILTYDVLHQRVAAFARYGVPSGHSAWTWDRERALLCRAQVLLAIQDGEAEVMRAMAPQADVICAPFAVRPRRLKATPVSGRCLYVGSRGPHNVLGLLWFLTEVWPIVLRACPQASLHVCGNICDVVTGDYSNVTWLGRVDDLDFEYNNTEVCLVPVRVGSGLEIKLVEALAYGRATVSTAIGLQGLRQFADRAVISADTPTDFGSAVSMLLRDTQRRAVLEHEAREMAATWLSPERCYQPFVDRILLHNHREHIAENRGS